MRTVTVFFVAKSLTTSVKPAGSTDTMTPEMLRKLPEITSSAEISVPSALFSPRARNWSPTRMAPMGAGCASSKRTEPGA